MKTKLRNENRISLSEKSSIQDLLFALEVVHDACTGGHDEFMDIVKKYFLEKVEKYDYEIAKNLLFVALGALIMPSRRGAISEIITYNFDDMLEWYLHIHGFTTQRVINLPFVESRCDVRIYHPHGYIPLAKSYMPGKPTGVGSESIVFTLYDYERLIASKDDAWKQTLSAIMKRHIPLMVGLSFDDLPLRLLAAEVKGEMEKEKSWESGDSWRPIGILLKTEEELKGKEDGLIKRGIAPVGFEDYDEIWKFLLSVCQLAAT